MSNGKTRNFHLPLPESLYAELRAEAEAAGVPATTLVRGAVEGWLRERKRAQRYAEMQAYAAALAGTQADLDEALSEASATFLATER